MSDDAVSNHSVISLSSKANVHIIHSTVLTSKYHILFHLWPSTACVSPFHFSSSKHITTLNQHKNATFEQDDSKTYLAVYLRVDFSVVNCVKYSPRSNTMLTDISRHQTCVFRTQMKYEDTWCHWSGKVYKRNCMNKLTNWECNSSGCRGQTLFIGIRGHSCWCRSDRGVKLTTTKTGTESYNAWE